MRPLVLVELDAEFFHLTRVRHVDESLTLVRLTFFVDWHLEEVVTTQEPFVNLVQQYILCQSVRNIFNHQSSEVRMCSIFIIEVYEISFVILQIGGSFRVRHHRG
jgi:hypothetical protein